MAEMAGEKTKAASLTQVLPARAKPKREPRVKEAKAEGLAKQKLAVDDRPPDAMFKEGFLAEVYQENSIQPDGIKKVKTRFPPEPNGHLHIGHARAIAINFGFARYHGGECYLRFDDTNPETAKDNYYDLIQETVKWLGFEPAQITYSSDHFDRLYELAGLLIQEGGAYVCHCSSESGHLSIYGKHGRLTVARKRSRGLARPEDWQRSICVSSPRPSHGRVSSGVQSHA